MHGGLWFEFCCSLLCCPVLTRLTYICSGVKVQPVVNGHDSHTHKLSMDQQRLLHAFILYHFLCAVQHLELTLNGWGRQKGRRCLMLNWHIHKQLRKLWGTNCTVHVSEEVTHLSVQKSHTFSGHQGMHMPVMQSNLLCSLMYLYPWLHI